tara:strand:- start:483 stop:1853 length:1371 start_codon:yes stop_codon:yes gene_type:complete
MNMASQQLGNDYNLEIHRLSTVQDEMARLDDLIANWHDTEATAATAASSERRAEEDQLLSWARLQAQVANDTTNNRMKATEQAMKEASMPQQTRDSIQSVATLSKDMDITNVSELIQLHERSGEFAHLGSLGDLQKHEAAVALKEAMISKANAIPGAQVTGDEIAAISAAVQRLTGVPELEMTSAAYSARRTSYINDYRSRNSYAGSVPPRPGAATTEGSGERVAVEGQLTPNDILTQWMDRRKELEAELEGGLPSAPTYEDVRARASEQYQPRSAKETRAAYKEEMDQQQQMRDLVSQFPKEQRILMQAGRNAQRYADGDLEAISELSETEGDAATFIREQLQAGTLSMNEIIPYAKRIAEAENMDGSPEEVVGARDRILSDAMAGLMSSYRNTLPSGDIAQAAKENVRLEAQNAQMVGMSKQGVDYDSNAPTEADRRQDPDYIPNEETYRSLLE